tara:strand:+ start:656 stop:1069 length:414 start_codon:yes stop_codon:yes gene_type:complete
MNKENASKVSEMIGLAFLLTASVWQFGFSDPAEGLASDWQNHIIENVQYPTLYSLQKIADEISTEDQNLKLNIANTVRDTTNGAIKTLDEEVKRRKDYKEGQLSFLQKLRNTLFIIGSIFVIFSKFLELKKEEDSIV